MTIPGNGYEEWSEDMFCYNCGSKLSDNARFCGSCGSALRSEPLSQNTIALSAEQIKIGLAVEEILKEELEAHSPVSADEPTRALFSRSELAEQPSPPAREGAQPVQPPEEMENTADLVRELNEILEAAQPPAVPAQEAVKQEPALIPEQSQPPFEPAAAAAPQPSTQEQTQPPVQQTHPAAPAAVVEVGVPIWEKAGVDDGIATGGQTHLPSEFHNNRAAVDTAMQPELSWREEIRQQTIPKRLSEEAVNPSIPYGQGQQPPQRYERPRAYAPAQAQAQYAPPAQPVKKKSIAPLLMRIAIAVLTVAAELFIWFFAELQVGSGPLFKYAVMLSVLIIGAALLIIVGIAAKPAEFSPAGERAGK